MNIYQLFLEPDWALSQQPMRPKAEWAIDSVAIRARGIIVLVKSNQLVKNNETKQLSRFSRHCFGFQSRRFSLLGGYNIQPSSISTNQNAAMIIDRQLDFTKMLFYDTVFCETAGRASCVTLTGELGSSLKTSGV